MKLVDAQCVIRGILQFVSAGKRALQHLWTGVYIYLLAASTSAFIYLITVFDNRLYGTKNASIGALLAAKSTPG